MYSVSDETRKPIFEGVQGENEAREIQFDVTAWVEELGEGVCTATAKRPTDTTPYPVTVTRSGNVVTWKPNSVDTAIEGVGAFQLEYSINDSIAKTRIWNTKIAPSLDPAGDPPDPYDNWLAEMRQIAADAIQAAADAEESAQEAESYTLRAFIVKSASGDIASFADGADDVPMKSLNITITPKQSGSGDPSPSNVRAITGWSTVNATVEGKNLLDTSEMSTAGQSGATFTRSSDGIITVGGHANSNTYKTIGTLQTKNGVQYTLTGTPSGGASGKYRMTVAGYGYDYGSGYTFTGDGNAHLVTIDIYTNYPATGSTLTFAPMIRLASDTDDTYEPYTGTTKTTALGRTVYGGTVDVVTGVLTVTWAAARIGALSWGYNSNGNYLYTSSVNKRTGSFNIMSDIYATATVDDVTRMGDYHIKGSAANNNVFVTDSRYTTAADFKSANDQRYIYIEAATPTTIQLTPTQVASLLGTNNVWADCGDIAVEYRADPTLAYAELANVIVSLGGNI